MNKRVTASPQLPLAQLPLAQLLSALLLLRAFALDALLKLARRSRLIGLAVLCAVPFPVGAQTPARSPADQLLSHLVGDWTMTGDVVGHPVTYSLAVQRTLRDQYVELHMVEAGQPSRYEARVFIGVDTSGRGYIAHWIDNTGATFSVPPGTGAAHGDTIVIAFPYSGRPMRDAFAYDAKSDSWHFALDYVSSSGAKTHFAAYGVKITTAVGR
jgi:hypothetical protein